MKEDVPEEEDDLKIHPSSLKMTEAEVEFVVAQAEEMAKHQAIPDSIRDEAEVEAKMRPRWRPTAGSSVRGD
ncbi:hypothetical protein D1007_30907 [Hordeum vulgare]|nr:hypothetical protein D1007_30907 [Hordeum vulgare]